MGSHLREKTGQIPHSNQMQFKRRERSTQDSTILIFCVTKRKRRRRWGQRRRFCPWYDRTCGKLLDIYFFYTTTTVEHFFLIGFLAANFLLCTATLQQLMRHGLTLLRVRVVFGAAIFVCLCAADALQWNNQGPTEFHCDLFLLLHRTKAENVLWWTAARKTILCHNYKYGNDCKSAQRPSCIAQPSAIISFPKCLFPEQAQQLQTK